MTIAWPDESGFVDTYLAWLARCVALGGELDYVAFVERARDSNVLGYLGWIKPITYPADKVKRLAKKLPWLRTHTVGDQLVLVVGPSPTVIPTDEQVKELDRVFESLANA